MSESPRGQSLASFSVLQSHNGTISDGPQGDKLRSMKTFQWIQKSSFWLALPISRLHLLHHGMPRSGITALSGNHLSQKSSTWSHANSKWGYQSLGFPCIKENALVLRANQQQHQSCSQSYKEKWFPEVTPKSSSGLKANETSLESQHLGPGTPLESSENLINDSVVLLNIYMRRWGPASFLSWRQNVLCQIWIIL